MDFHEDAISVSQIFQIEYIINIANIATAKRKVYQLPMSHVLYEERRKVSGEEIMDMCDFTFRTGLGALYLSTRRWPHICKTSSMIAKLQGTLSQSH